MSATFIISLEKKQSKRTDTETIKRQLIEIATRGVAGKRAVWSFSEISGFENPLTVGDGILYKATISFRRRKLANTEMLDAEMHAISEFMAKSGVSMKWSVKETKPSWITEKSDDGDEANDFVDFDRSLSFDEITIPEVLIHGSDEEIEDYPAFSDIYGRAAHVRTMAASMQTVILTKGKRRNHLVLHGLPGCGKSSLFHAWQNSVLPKGSYIRINANSSTKAGLEDLFLSRLRDVGTPPFLFVEEMEKTLPDILTIWLSILDERAEVRKIVHRKLRYAEVRSLVFATVNDKMLFDRLMAGRPGNPGALSSRMTGLYVPRPDEAVMARILRRDIDIFYPEAGVNREDWVRACLELAKQVKTTDPRKIVTFLDGRNRLLTEEYQRDIVTLYELEVSDRKQATSDEDFEEEMRWDGRRTV
jgi:hypothetical protein